jgi:DNA modification methylase
MTKPPSTSSWTSSSRSRSRTTTSLLFRRGPAPGPATSTASARIGFCAGTPGTLGPTSACWGTRGPTSCGPTPPYGVSYEGKTRARLRIENDGLGELEALLRESFARIDAALRDGAPLYVGHPGGLRALVFGEAFCAVGWQLRQTLVWVKDAMVLGHSDYHYRHEQLLYGFKPGKGRLGRGGRGWYGGDAETSIFEVERPRAALEHPTMKPPELIESALRNSSRRREIVLDPFAGSGSTLVAAEHTGRRAYLIELDPRYCEVVCDRYEALTGAKAERIARG